MQIRPLRKKRYITMRDGKIKTHAMYGYPEYITSQNRFVVFFEDGSWYIKRGSAAMSLYEQLCEDGLFDVAFPRRKDAVEALEITTEGIE